MSTTLNADEYVIEMEWACSPGCGSTNPGLALACACCGRPKTKNNDVMPEDTSEAAAITDEKRLARALSGPAWKCGYCDLMAPVGASCVGCGAPCPTAPASASPAPGERPAWEGIKPSFASFAETEPMRHQERPRLRPMPRPGRGRAETWGAIAEPRAARFPWKKVVGGALALLVLGAVLLFGWRLTREHEVLAVVESVRWTHTVTADRWQAAPGEGWEAPPGAVNVRVVDPHREHGTHKVFDHSEQADDPNAPTDCGQTCVPSTAKPACKALGNGTAKCKKPPPVCTPKPCPPPPKIRVDVYRNETTYDAWLAWEMWDWEVGVDRATLKGTTLETRWPDPPVIPLAPQERARTWRSASYALDLLGPDASYTVALPDEETFHRYPVGAEVRLLVSPLGARLAP